MTHGIPSAPDRPAGSHVRLRLLATTDLHANLLPYDYYRDRPDDGCGLARVATLIAAARADAANSLLFDNGDLIAGTPLADLVVERGLRPGDRHPVLATMDAIGFDGAAIGNHDFDYGLDVMLRACADAAHPVVCANVTRPDGTPLLPPWRVLDRDVADDAGHRHPIRIGIIGFLPPQILRWAEDRLAGRVVADDIVDAARRHLPALRAAADIVVALCHSGIDGTPRHGGEENAALYLAAVPGIDAIISGHQHLVFPGRDFADAAPASGIDATAGRLAGVPAVMAGANGSHLGVIDLDLVIDAGGWRVTGAHSEARPIARPGPQGEAEPLVASDPAVLAAADAAHRQTLDHIRQPIGQTALPLTTHWATIGETAALRLVTLAQRWYVTERAEVHLPDLPILSATAPFRAGGHGTPFHYVDIPPGPLTLRAAADLCPYPNRLCVLRLSGADVAEWLERSAGQFRRLDPGGTGPQMLLDPRFPSFNFDVIDGVTYRIDVTRPSRYDLHGALADPRSRRITGLAHAGRPVKPDDEFLLVTNSYRAGGGGSFPGSGSERIVYRAPITNRDAVLAFMARSDPADLAPRGAFGLLPLPEGLEAVVLSSPLARPAEAPPGLSLTRDGDTADGFGRFRLATLPPDGPRDGPCPQPPAAAT